MEGALVYSIAREKDPSFQKELKFLLSSAKVSRVELSAMSFAEAENYISAHCSTCKFIYFYDEDPYLLNLAMSLGIACFGHPYSFAYSTDLGLFYKRMKDLGIAHPLFYSFPNLKNERPQDFFTYLSSSIEEAGLKFPFYLRKKDDEGFARKLCLTPVEFNATLKKMNDSDWVAEEYIPSPAFYALVIGKRCFGVLEEKSGKLVLSSFDTSFVRSQAVKIAKTLRFESALVMFRMHGKMPLACGIYPGKYFRTFSANFGNQPGEALFNRLSKARRGFSPYFYAGSKEVKENRRGAKAVPLKNPHSNKE